MVWALVPSLPELSPGECRMHGQAFDCQYTADVWIVRDPPPGGVHPVRSVCEHAGM